MHKNEKIVSTPLKDLFLHPSNLHNIIVHPYATPNASPLPQDHKPVEVSAVRSTQSSQTALPIQVSSQAYPTQPKGRPPVKVAM